jgi:MSHA pilin protein MshB
MRKEYGFTLIEIVVVIVLIGILSAVALPRFFNFTGEAQKAAVQGTAGAFASGISMAQTKWLMSNQDAFINIAGEEIKMSDQGYPMGVAGINGGTALSDQSCAIIATKMLSDNSVTFGSKQNAGNAKSYTFISVPYDEVSARVGE